MKNYQSSSVSFLSRFVLGSLVFIFLLFMFIYSANTVNASTNCWYDSDWCGRIKITIDHTKINSTLSGFPVYIDLSSLGNNFFTSVQSDGDDIRITKADGVTELPFELVSLSTISETGELYFKADSISSTSSSDFYLYYGNPAASGYSATSSYGRNAVWNDFDTVYHMENDGTDSTENGYNLGLNNSPSFGSTLMGNGLNLGLTNSNKGLRTANEKFGFTSATETYHNSIWIKPKVQPASGTFQVINNRIYGENPGNQMRLVYSYLSPGNYRIQNQDDFVYGNSYDVNLSLDNWYRLDALHDGSVAYLYLNGSLVSTSSVTGTGVDYSFYPDEMTIGVQRLGNSEGFKGDIDEMRMIRGGYKSADWIAAEYANQSDPASFYSIE